jgi:hypothetical protein
VEHPGELPEIARLRALGAAAHPVEVELTTGELLHGELLAIAPPDRRRLSDLLNRGETFLPLVDAGRTFYATGTPWPGCGTATARSASRPPLLYFP